MKKQRSIRLFAAAVALSAGLSTAAVWPARAENVAPVAGESASNPAAASPSSSSLASQAAGMPYSPAWLLLVTVLVGALSGSAGAVVFNVREARR